MGSELNIYKIAQEAGVSPATVSRVMTKNARVSEEKRALAQGLIKTKTNVIGVLAADLVNPYYSSMVENCEKEIIARGYVPMICGTLSNPDLEVEYVQKMFGHLMSSRRLIDLLLFCFRPDDHIALTVSDQGDAGWLTEHPFIFQSRVSGSHLQTACTFTQSTQCSG